MTGLWHALLCRCGYHVYGEWMGSTGYGRHHATRTCQHCGDNHTVIG